MNNIRPLFSISAFVALALVGTGSAYLINNNHKVEKLIQEEPEVLKSMEVPQVVVPPTPAPTTTYEVPNIEAPKRRVPKKTIPAPMQVKVADATPKPCDLVCGDFENSVLFANGGRFRRCECKK